MTDSDSGHMLVAYSSSTGRCSLIPENAGETSTLTDEQSNVLVELMWMCSISTSYIWLLFYCYTIFYRMFQASLSSTEETIEKYRFSCASHNKLTATVLGKSFPHVQKDGKALIKSLIFPLQRKTIQHAVNSNNSSQGHLVSRFCFCNKTQEFYCVFCPEKSLSCNIFLLTSKHFSNTNTFFLEEQCLEIWFSNAEFINCINLFLIIKWKKMSTVWNFL